VIDLAPGEDVVCRFTNEYPTAVDLLSFTAHAGADNVTLNWQTASELDTEGFNVWRSQSQDGPYIQVNASLIAARGNADTGASYEYTDTDVEQDVTYFYKLEDVDGSGISTYHGPVSATPTRTWQISLPFISGGIVFSKRRMRRRKMRRA
jgi:hypothetical protein